MKQGDIYNYADIQMNKLGNELTLLSKPGNNRISITFVPRQ